MEPSTVSRSSGKRTLQQISDELLCKARKSESSGQFVAPRNLPIPNIDATEDDMMNITGTQEDTNYGRAWDLKLNAKCDNHVPKSLFNRKNILPVRVTEECSYALKDIEGASMTTSEEEFDNGDCNGIEYATTSKLPHSTLLNSCVNVRYSLENKDITNRDINQMIDLSKEKMMISHDETDYKDQEIENVDDLKKFP